jgi:hypothetical protein
MENNMDYWMFWVTAAIFTVLGYYFGRKEPVSLEHSKKITKETIDTLIDMGFIKTSGTGDDTKMLKYYEEE